MTKLQRKWLERYFNEYKKELFKDAIHEGLYSFYKLAIKIKKNSGKLIFAGNGASAAIASHCAVDFTKSADVRAVAFNDAGLITCFVNDYGYEHWVEKALNYYADPKDAVVLISSSGKSPNMVNAARFAREKGLKIVTFTGFSKDNPLRQMGGINLWVDSSSYNIVECTHMLWLTTVVDMIDAHASHLRK
jgi:D-sedoheptulose 7-phosphate isomerase